MQNKLCDLENDDVTMLNKLKMLTSKTGQNPVPTSAIYDEKLTRWRFATCIHMPHVYIFEVLTIFKSRTIDLLLLIYSVKVH